jgi:hypothetical protein
MKKILSLYLFFAGLFLLLTSMANTCLADNHLLLDITDNGAGTYVAVGENGSIVSSVDSVTWTYQNNPDTSTPKQTLRSVTYGGGKFVAVGNKGIILTRADGQSWMLASAHANQNSNLANVVYGQDANGKGQYVAAGGKTILTSSDGLRWEPQRATVPSGEAQWNSLVEGLFYANGSYLLVGSASVPRVGSAKNNGGTFVLRGVNSNALWTWQEAYAGYKRLKFPDGSPAGDSGALYNLVYGNGQFVAVGSALGRFIILKSLDATEWTIGYGKENLPDAIPGRLRSVLYSQELSAPRYVAVGNTCIEKECSSAILASKTAQLNSWDATLEYKDAPRSLLMSIASGKGAATGAKYVAVGSQGLADTEEGSVGIILTSAEGATKWRALSPPAGVTWPSLTKVIYARMTASNHYQYVAIGGTQAILSSEDGEEWRVTATQ